MFNGCWVDLDEYKIQNINSVVYPNPSSAEVTIEFESIEKTSVNIFDIRGNLVYFEESISSPFKIDLADFSSGLYYYELSTSNEISRGEFIVSK